MAHGAQHVVEAAVVGGEHRPQQRRAAQHRLAAQHRPELDQHPAGVADVGVRLVPGAAARELVHVEVELHQAARKAAPVGRQRAGRGAARGTAGASGRRCRSVPWG